MTSAIVGLVENINYELRFMIVTLLRCSGHKLLPPTPFRPGNVDQICRFASQRRTISIVLFKNGRVGMFICIAIRGMQFRCTQVNTNKTTQGRGDRQTTQPFVT